MAAPTVLIIANPFEARVARRAVEEAGLVAAIAEGGEGAIEKLVAEKPAAVVLSLGLYYAEATELLQELRAHSQAPVVLVGDTTDAADTLPVQEFLLRPIDAVRLRARLEVVMGRGEEKSKPAPKPADRWFVNESSLFSQRPSDDLDAFGDDSLLADPPIEAPAAALGPPIDEPVRPKPTLAGRLETALAGAERRIFRARRVTGSHVTIKLVADQHLGLDSLPGIDAELGLSPASPSKEAAPEKAAAPAPAAAHADTVISRIIASSAATLSARSAAPGALPDLDAGAATDVADAGTLAEESLPAVLCRLHRDGFSGRLILRSGDGEKAIYFDSGYPVHAASNLPHDRLGELLWREGRISRDQHAKSRILSEKSGRRVIEALVEINAVKRDELFKVLRHHVEEIIYSCFGWDRGTFAIDRDNAGRDEKVSIAHPYAIALEGIRRKYGLERLVAAVGSVDTPLSATPGMWRITADAGLSPSEREAVQLLRRGAHTVAELQAQGKLDRIGAYGLAHGLLVLRAAQRGEAQVTAAEGPGPEELIVDRERVLAKHAQVQEGDYFAILGVGRGATAYEIRRAYERSRHDFSPERFAPEVRKDLAPRLAEVMEVIEEAGRALGDDRLREAYRSRLPE